MGIWTSIFRPSEQELPPSPLLKEQPEVKVKSEEVIIQPKSRIDYNQSATTEGTVADYTYKLKATKVETNASGDTFQVLTFKVLYKGNEIGLMSVHHNRFGAFAHFTDTLSYPLG